MTKMMPELPPQSPDNHLTPTSRRMIQNGRFNNTPCSNKLHIFGIKSGAEHAVLTSRPYILTAAAHIRMELSNLGGKLPCPISKLPCHYSGRTSNRFTVHYPMYSADWSRLEPLFGHATGILPSGLPEFFLQILEK
ncbi:hypothetical protein AVEN_133737-1 [Araneus ventricosus]|uniref:Uncharacterized protein n=1 Tax=Araneus ventricosus TaxID=182803 RepID=A0A4Y2B9K7_ARAVE|nr:hypothetical protein AVEN_133737-1 [Araneus ventricosus]